MNFFIGLIDYKEKKYLLHSHIGYEILLYTEGCGHFFTDKTDFEVKSGDIIVVPPGTLHRTVLVNDLKSIAVMGDFAQFFNLSELAVLSDNKKREGACLAQMIADNRYGGTDYTAALCNAYARFILKNLTINNPLDTAVSEICREITDKFFDNSINLREILNRSGYAEDYVRTHFKKVTGKTPTSFLTEIRINHACALINLYKNTTSLTEIAAQCGYSDYIYFSRKFKAVTGMSPQKYKKTNS